ncbi:MAG: hypothetical protein J6B06_07760 [Lachnospiraceae bacterium]|nr:hypothetical protein [Lachnospiraceae bacterium]
MTEKAKRNYKDTVFRMLFKKPQYALSLYNALNNTNYTDPALLRFNTLENAIYMNFKNDISFLIAHQMNLYEHQSTFNPNMPLRDLFYISDIIQEYVKDMSLYSSKLIRLPNPSFIVFYNGLDSMPERSVLKLSDAYELLTDNPSLDLKINVLNINPGMNEDLKNKCPVLKEYTLYVELVRHYRQFLSLTEAVSHAIEDCIQNNILREFLFKQKSEVIKVSIYEYDEEREMRLFRQAEREYAMELAMEEVTKSVTEKVTKAVTEKIRRESINTFISALQELKIDEALIFQKLTEKFHLTDAEAHDILYANSR